MKSSFELGGYEKGEEDVKTPPRKTKAVTNPITGETNISITKHVSTMQL